MADDILAGQWKQLRGEIKLQWGKLTDDELDQLEGNLEKLMGFLQEKYGYSKITARQKIDELEARFRSSPEAEPATPSPGGQRF